MFFILMENKLNWLNFGHLLCYDDEKIVIQLCAAKGFNKFWNKEIKILKSNSGSVIFSLYTFN